MPTVGVAWTHNSETKSYMPYQLSQPGVPTCAFKVEATRVKIYA